MRHKLKYAVAKDSKATDLQGAWHMDLRLSGFFKLVFPFSLDH